VCCRVGATNLLFASRGYGARSVGDAEPSRSRLDLSLDEDGRACGNRRRWPSMHRADDVTAVDALKVDAGDPEVGVSQLPLNHHERNPLVRHLDSACVPQPDVARSGA
jgi:hypothetical protein